MYEEKMAAVLVVRVQHIFKIFLHNWSQECDLREKTKFKLCVSKLPLKAIQEGNYYFPIEQILL